MVRVDVSRAPRFGDAAQTLIDLHVFIPGLEGSHPATVKEGGDAFARAMAGEFGPIEPFEPPPKPLDVWLMEIRAERLRRVCAAYVDSGRRLSLYGYLALLAAMRAERVLLDEQARHHETLVAAGLWEREMLVAAGRFADMEDRPDISDDALWPPLDPAVAKALVDLAREN
jgi:hypothetical protein